MIRHFPRSFLRHHLKQTEVAKPHHLHKIVVLFLLGLPTVSVSFHCLPEYMYMDDEKVNGLHYTDD